MTNADRLAHYRAWLARNRERARARFWMVGGIVALMALDYWQRQEERWV